MNKARKIILYADDDVDDQELFKEAFHRIDAAIDIRIASGGEECLTLLSSLTDQELPSLIVLDYNMPDLTGLEVVERLCSDKRYQYIPKVIDRTGVLTGNLCMHVSVIKLR